MTEQQKESYDNVIDMLYSCAQLLQMIYEGIEAHRPLAHQPGKIDIVNNGFHEMQAAWNQCIGNMDIAANNLGFLRPDYKPQTQRLAEYLESLKNNTLIR
ncbi:MAG: hypothetical protein M3142_15855 [Bacteroidota bacterium]|nr:hypothetical protein [Bacteroidota bacterium]